MHTPWDSPGKNTGVGCHFLLQCRKMKSESEAAQLCPTLCDPIDGSPPGPPLLWDSPGKNTGVGCHFLLQCLKVKSESEAAQLCRTLSDPMDCSLPGSSHGIFQTRVLEWVAIAPYLRLLQRHFMACLLKAGCLRRVSMALSDLAFTYLLQRFLTFLPQHRGTCHT